MNLSWKDYLAMHWPYLVMGLFAIVGTVYTVGFKQGQGSILFAAAKSSYEAKTGATVE